MDNTGEGGSNFIPQQPSIAVGMADDEDNIDFDNLPDQEDDH